MKIVKIVVGLLMSILLLTFIIFFYYRYQISPISNKSENVIVTISNGSISSIGDTLYENGLIRNTFVYKIYIKLNNITNLKASTYKLNKNMSLKEIVSELEKGNNYNPEQIMITFKEGLNIRKVALVIADNTNNSYDDVMNLMNDSEYIKELINEYWFLTDDILNSKIYYPLEGYLFPETYAFKNANVSVKEIVHTMLDETDKRLQKYKDSIAKSDYSIHELITLASIVELEGASSSDRASVAGVFYNRLHDNWQLGSDVTTYYYLKIDDFKVSLNGNKGLFDCDYAYNTRCNNFIGLPVGAISNPGEESLDAIFNYKKHDNYYFVADCQGKTYLSKNISEHYNIINKLKNEGNWCA